LWRCSPCGIGNYNVARILVLNKPYGVLCQFTDGGGRPTLKDFVDVPGVYPVRN